MKNETSVNEEGPAKPGSASEKNIILKELENLTNEGKFEDLVNLYIATYVELQPDPECLRKIKKKVVKKLKVRKEAFKKANLDKVKMKVLDAELELQIGMVQNELTRTIILLVSYMVKHGNDATTKEVFRWVKEQQKDEAAQVLNRTMEKVIEVKQP